MSKVAQRLPAAPQANRVSTSIHGNPLLSTGFAVSFAVKGDGKKAGVSVFGDLRTKKKEPQSLLVGALPIFANDSRNSGLSTSCTCRSE